MIATKKTKKIISGIRDVAGSGPLGVGLCILLFLVFWKIDKAFGLGSLWGEEVLHYVLAGVLLIAGGVMTYAAFRAMPLAKHSKYLVKHGVYSYVRHPRYAAAVFLIYPAFGLIVHSFVCLVSTVAAYAIFRLASLLEERKGSLNRSM